MEKIQSGGDMIPHQKKNGPIWRIFENLQLAVKQSYQKGQF